MLTKQNKIFAEEYVANHYNATEAYLAAYNTTKKNANKNAYTLLKKPEVLKYIQEIQKERTERLNINADRVLEELSNMAFAEKGDKDYTATAKLKALELIQKQIGAQAPAKIEADVNQQVVFIDDVGQDQ